MNIEEKLKMRINIAVAQRFHCNFTELTWEKLNKGYSNDKFVIKMLDDTPLALCKIYRDRDIISYRKRIKREQLGIELLARNVAPDFIRVIPPNILIYAFIPGNDLTEKTNITEEDMNNIKQSINVIHVVSRKRKTASRYDLINFYNDLFKDYKNSEIIDDELLDELVNSIKDVAQIAIEKENEITYVHGDLVPANILFQKYAVYFIDWEYFRVDLPAFDYVYFNYYAKKHNLPTVSLPDTITDREIDVYERLIESLDKIWWRYRELSTKNE